MEERELMQLRSAELRSHLWLQAGGQSHSFHSACRAWVNDKKQKQTKIDNKKKIHLKFWVWNLISTTVSEGSQDYGHPPQSQGSPHHSAFSLYLLGESQERSHLIPLYAKTWYLAKMSFRKLCSLKGDMLFWKHCHLYQGLSCQEVLRLRVNEYIYLWFLKNIIFIYLFIFGCVGSSLLCAGFLWLRWAGATLHCGARASHWGGFSCCGARALGTSVVVARGL